MKPLKIYTDKLFSIAVPFIRTNRRIALGAAIGLIFVAAAISYAVIDNHSTGDPGISHYTCPMHHQVKENHPGVCPICHMDLVAVYRPGFGPGSETSGSVDAARGQVQVSDERQRLIGVKLHTVKIENLQIELTATGRIAFDPELALAVREYIQIASRDPSLRRAAESRLRLLGMGDEEIRGLRSGDSSYRSLYLPEKAGSVWVYATLYENEADWVKPGTTAVIEIPGTQSEKLTGTVRSISPVVDAKTRSLTARIEVAAAGRTLRPDTYVDVHIIRSSIPGLLVPRSAVLDTGNRKVVYIFTPPDRFAPIDIRTGAEGSESVIVTHGLKEGDRVVSRAAFMIDSESRLMSPEYYQNESEQQSDSSTHNGDHTSGAQP